MLCCACSKVTSPLRYLTCSLFSSHFFALAPTFARFLDRPTTLVTGLDLLERSSHRCANMLDYEP